MSMPALLSHFGITSVRYVTTSGRVIFDGVQHTQTGFRHPQYGAVTPVQPLTFHGDEEIFDNEAAAVFRWWDDKTALQVHIDAMQQAFPGFLYLAPKEGQVPGWCGSIDTGRGTFTILIGLRADGGLPFITRIKGARFGVSVRGQWFQAPHLHPNGDMCVAGQDDWRPQEHTAATATAWAAHWLAAYTEWRISRRWPTTGHQIVA